MRLGQQSRNKIEEARFTEEALDFAANSHFSLVLGVVCASAVKFAQAGQVFTTAIKCAKGNRIVGAGFKPALFDFYPVQPLARCNPVNVYREA